MKRFLLFSLLMSCFPFFMTGCASSGKVSINPEFRPAPEQGIVYILPFTTTMVPSSFSDKVFDTFVDTMNASREGTGIRWFYIIKEEPQELDPAWLARQLYITGDFWSYVEEPGCCSAELRVKGKVRLHQGSVDPVAEAYVPLETFFEYDKSTIEAERDLLAIRLAETMANRIIPLLAPR